MSRTDAEPPEGPPAAPEGRRSRAARLAATRDGGPGGTGPSQPQFSQPVRQILLMLIVLVLVVAGAWFAYGRILSIFHSNEYLNGLILAVFVMGVLGCFWQVAELVKSVSWIERFAARRRNAAERGVSAAEPAGPDDAPRLLAPLAALLGQRGPVGGAISTESSRSILESVATRIDEARDITRYLANLLIFLGLLGTFYGLATTVPAVVDTIRALSPKDGETGLEVFNKLMTGLESQLGGMATAFSSSLLGLAGSLVVGLLELFVAHGQNRFYRELEEWMSGFTRIGLGGGDGQGLGEAALAGFIERVEAQMTGLQDFYLRRDELRDQEAAAADQRSLALAEGVERLAGLLGSDRDRLGETLAAEREATAQALAGVERAIGGLAEPRRDPDLVAVLERLAEGQDRLSAEPRHDPALPAVLERLAAGQERLAALAEAPAQPGFDGAVLGEALERLAEGQARLATLAEAPAPEDGRLARALERLAEGQERILDLGAQRPAAAAAAAGDDPEARMRLRSIDVQLGRLVEETASGRDGLIAELRSDLAALTRAIRNLERGDGT
ncbi:hypothetical protein EQ718_11075 [Paracoccus versutus]|uniref:Biopolymer transporter ExbB n=2 Tax=Paracoccus versutus TaxID=34007 RepID=A0AAQ0HJZ1_PARVE|nr:hypothetical protein IT40_21545 [Paracoccus versutus]REG54187.1 hypothetical protein ATH84_1005157 [Paracoccus versutus]WEJ79372.1 hypothetical protein EQ718_11075 [Paracoccus versutus]